MAIRYAIEKQRWAGWLEVPAAQPGWPASPVMIADVVPPKTGQGRLALEFLQPLFPGGGRRRRVELRVIQHGPTHLVGAFLDSDGVGRTGVVSSMSFDWLASYCPDFFSRRPPQAVTMAIDGKPAWENTPEVHLDCVLGRSADEILHGATAAGFGVELQAMSERSTRFMLDVTCRCRPGARSRRRRPRSERMDSHSTIAEVRRHERLG